MATNGMFEFRKSKKDKELKVFIDSLDPNMDEMEKINLVEEYKHRPDEDAIQAMCYSRVDGEERRLAFFEALVTAIQTDDEYWVDKSEDILWALGTNNAERLLIGLCGWGANNLAKLARIVPDDASEFLLNNSATLIVRWSDRKISTSRCIIDQCTFEIIEFDDEVFTPRTYMAEVESVCVEVQSEFSDSKYCFACITAEERERTNDMLSYWYSLEQDEEDK